MHFVYFTRVRSKISLDGYFLDNLKQFLMLLLCNASIYISVRHLIIFLISNISSVGHIFIMIKCVNSIYPVSKKKKALNCGHRGCFCLSIL